MVTFKFEYKGSTLEVSFSVYAVVWAMLVVAQLAHVIGQTVVVA